MGFDVMRGFKVGQEMAGENALGVFAKQALERVQSVQDAKMKSQMELETQKQLIPMKEESAMRLLQEKSKLFPQQPRALSSDAAGRLSLASQGEKFSQRARSLLFPTGQVDSFRRHLAGASQNSLGRTFGNPFARVKAGEAQDVEFYVKRAIDSQLRAETGATAPDRELDRLTQAFMSNAYADPNSAMTRLSELEEGLRKVRMGIDPTGYYSGLGSSPFEPVSTDDDVSGLSDEEIMRQLGQ